MTTAPVSPDVSPATAGRELAELFEEHGRMVFGLCRVMLRHHSEAEDATQQTFLSAHQSLLRGTTPRDPAAWLATIARNECRARIRRQMAAPLALVGEESVTSDFDGDVDRRGEIEALCRALAELPRPQREVVLLRDFYGLSYKEISVALGVTVPAVEALLFRTRKLLQEHVRPAQVASGAIALPAALHSSLSHAIPGFAAHSGSGSAGILGTVAAKTAAAPLVAKLAAALAVAAGTTVAATSALHGGPAVKPALGKQPAKSSPVAVAAGVSSAGWGREHVAYATLTSGEADPKPASSGGRHRPPRTSDGPEQADQSSDGGEDVRDDEGPAEATHSGETNDTFDEADSEPALEVESESSSSGPGGEPAGPEEPASQDPPAEPVADAG